MKKNTFLNKDSHLSSVNVSRYEKQLWGFSLQTNKRYYRVGIYICQSASGAFY